MIKIFAEDLEMLVTELESKKKEGLTKDETLQMAQIIDMIAERKKEKVMQILNQATEKNSDLAKMLEEWEAMRYLEENADLTKLAIVLRYKASSKNKMTQSVVKIKTENLIEVIKRNAIWMKKEEMDYVD